MANFNFNRVILGGRITADPELKATAAGIPVCSFSVAVNRKGKDGEQKTDFIDCQAWRTTAQFVSRFFKKGGSICLVGSIQVRSWDDKDGNKRYSTEVVVDEAYFVDSKSSNTPPSPKLEEVPNNEDIPF